MRKYVMLLALVLCFGIIQLSPAATWTIDKVTDNTEQDLYPFVTFVSSGLLSVYAHNDGDIEVFVANNFSGPWATSRVTDNTYFDIGLDIASRPGDNSAHIAIWWQDAPDQEISYCSGNPSSGWDIERVTDDADNDSWPSIEVDASGYAHMTYTKMTGGDVEIFYANNVTGSWVSEQVTDNASNDEVPWLALDSDGNPHIVFINGGVLYYTTKTAGVWTTPEYIVGGFGVNSLPYLVLDNENYAHVSYSKSDGTDNEIYYANNVTGSWQESKVTSNDDPDAYPTLFVDPHKHIHIAYLAYEPDAEIFYANNVGGVWDIGRVTDNSVDDVARFGRYFIPDPQRFGHIFFYNDSDGDPEIYHAHSNEPLFAGVEETPPAATPASINISPNPFSSRTTVSYSVPSPGNVSLKIFDVSGSLVRTLVDGTRQQGEYSVTWDGATSEGIQAAPGVYFYQLTVNGQTASVKGILK
jgi:hypothetical protein